MIRTINTKPTTMCLNCKKSTETTNERKEEWKEWYILIGICKVCNKNKVKKLELIKKQCIIKLLI